jgi:hypothetical protein
VRLFRSVALVAALVGIFSGCTGDAARTDLVPVTGTVTMDGQPLAGANLTFLPMSAEGGQGGTATTDSAGKYEAAHFRDGKGLAPGEYKVVVNKLVMQDGSPIPAGTQSAAELATKEAIPPQYSDYNTPTLKASVAAGGKPIDFALTSK